MIGFAGAVLAAQMEKSENLEEAGKLLQEALGVSYRLRPFVTSAKGRVPPHVPEDGMVAAALGTGGEIVDVQE